jgi:hypothetical protein
MLALGLSFVLQTTNVFYIIAIQKQRFFFSKSEIKMQHTDNSQLKAEKQKSFLTLI